MMMLILTLFGFLQAQTLFIGDESLAGFQAHDKNIFSIQDFIADQENKTVQTHSLQEIPITPHRFANGQIYFLNYLLKKFISLTYSLVPQVKVENGYYIFQPLAKVQSFVDLSRDAKHISFEKVVLVPALGMFCDPQGLEIAYTLEGFLDIWNSTLEGIKKNLPQAKIYLLEPPPFQSFISEKNFTQKKVNFFGRESTCAEAGKDYFFSKDRIKEVESLKKYNQYPLSAFWNILPLSPAFYCPQFFAHESIRDKNLSKAANLQRKLRELKGNKFLEEFVPAPPYESWNEQDVSSDCIHLSRLGQLKWFQALK